MSAYHFNPVRRPGATLLALLFGLLVTSSVSADILYIGDTAKASGTTINPGNIVARTFVNEGFFNVVTSARYTTYNTLNYTNGRSGNSVFAASMFGTPGFEFSFSPVAIGQPGQRAANFFNGNGAKVQAASFLALVDQVGILSPSYLWINCTNIINKGLLIGGPNSDVRLEGRNIDLTRGVVEVAPIWTVPNGSFNGIGIFQPDVGISDRYWGTAENAVFQTAGIWNGISAVSLPHTVVQPPFLLPVGVQLFLLTNVYADSEINEEGFAALFYTNALGNPQPYFLRTNVVKQAVFVGAPSDIFIQSYWSPSEFLPDGNLARTISVLLSLQITNLVTGQPELAQLYIEDTLASQPNRGLLANIVGNTFRPTNYILARLPMTPPFFPPGNAGYPPPDFFLSSGQFDPNVNIDRVTNSRTRGVTSTSGYSALVDNIVSRAPSIPSGTVSNYPGRLRIFAEENLNLDRAALRGEGEIILQTPNLISFTNVIIDCENLSFNINKQSGSLQVKGMVKDNIARFRGIISAWSAVWSLPVQVVNTNNFFLTNVVVGGVTNIVPVPSPLTNNVAVRYHAFIVDATGLTNVVPVTVFDFVCPTPNLVIDDNMTIVQSLLFSNINLTLNGNVSLTSMLLSNAFGPSVLVSVPNWDRTVAPTILNFTNNGNLFILNEGHFGDDRSTPYSSWINNGFIDLTSLAVNSTRIENHGTFALLTGSLYMQGNSGFFENGPNDVAGDAYFQFSTLQFDNFSLGIGGGLDLTVSSSLSDLGPGANNLFVVSNGFNLNIKPTFGDLLGTILETVAPSELSIQMNHRWAGEDRGPNPSGYVNNVAVGELRMVGYSPDPLFFFSGNGDGFNHGLYVRDLDLTGLSDYTNQIQIADDLVIYYQNAFVNFTPPGGLSAEQYLDGQFGGHLRWVPAPIPSPGSPVLNIETPASGQEVHSTSAVVAGTSQSDSGVTWVYYKVNGSDWAPASTVNGGADWSGAVSLCEGTNVVQAFARDAEGDQSPVQSMSLIFVAVQPTITIQINGHGTVTPFANGEALAAGNNYAVTAHPSAGHKFSHWSGDVSGTDPTVGFTMQAGRVVVANFEALPYSPGAGSYSGLFFEPGDIDVPSSGAFNATTTPNGSYSGSLLMGKKKYAFTGKLSDDGEGTNSITRKGLTPLTLVFQVGSANAHITGTVSDSNWIAEINAERAPYGKSNPSPFKGKYTVVFPGSSLSDTNTPHGDSYGALNVDASGKASLTGVLADNTKISQSSSLSESGQSAIYVSLYSGGGHFLGWLTLSNTPQSDVGGWVNWIKPAIPADKFYPAGFDLLNTNVTGSTYTLPATPILNLPQGLITFNGGNLVEFANNFALAQNNKVTNLSTNKLSLSFVPGQGLFKGTVVDPLTAKSSSFNGAVLQKQNVGAGFFLGTNQSGKVSITAP